MSDMSDLESANFALSAGACCVKGGLVCDERGNPVCTVTAKLTQAEAENEAYEIAQEAQAALLLKLQAKLAHAEARAAELEKLQDRAMKALYHMATVHVIADDSPNKTEAIHRCVQGSLRDAAMKEPTSS